MNFEEYPAAYRDLRSRIIALGRGLDDEQVNATAPATPEWRVRDIVAHLTGICADVLDGNLDGVGTDAWTDKQVADRRDRLFADVLAEWEEKGPAIDVIIPNFPEIVAGQMIGDATTHEQDIRGALQQPGARDSSSLDIAFRWGALRLHDRDLIGGDAAGREGGAEPLELQSEAGTVIVGDGDPVATVRASRFDFVRAYTGRRSRGQIQAFDWDGDPRPERLVLSGFKPRETPLVE